MADPAPAKASSDESKSRGMLRVLQVRHREMPDSPSPEAILMVQRSVHLDDQGARLTLKVKRIDSQRPLDEKDLVWSAAYLPASPTERERVRLTHGKCSGPADIQMTLRGLRGYRIGTYLMAEIVAWAKQWPQAEVMKIKLSWVDEEPGAHDGENKARRDRFYEQFGISFTHTDTNTSITATSNHMLANELRTDEANQAWAKNIREVEATEWLVDQQRQLEEQDRQLDKFKRVAANRQTTIDQLEAHPYRFAVSRLLTNPLAWGCLGVVVVAASLAKDVVG